MFTDLPTDYIKQINTLLFQFLWSGHDKISSFMEGWDCLRSYTKEKV